MLFCFCINSPFSSATVERSAFRPHSSAVASALAAVWCTECNSVFRYPGNPLESCGKFAFEEGIQQMAFIQRL